MNDNKLTVLWTSGDPVTSTKMVLMYALNSKVNGWWDEVRLVIWGASAALVANNEQVRKHLEDVKDAGVIVEACRACADLLNVTGELENLGVDVKFYGRILTQTIRGDGHLITI